MKLLYLFVLCAASLNAYSQTTCDSLILLKSEVYGFKPANLSDSLKNEKSKELDLFWDCAKRHPKEAAECLNTLILKEEQDSYFCFDASSLLLSIDKEGKYYSTVVEGINKCKLEDLQLSAYLEICFFLGRKKQDVSGLANKLISIPKARIYLRNHFITLNAIDASFFLYNTMPEEAAEQALFEAIKKGNSTARHNASVVLTCLATTRGDSLIQTLIDNKQIGDSTVKMIQADRKPTTRTCSGSLLRRQEVLDLLKEAPYNFEKEFYGFADNEKLICSAIKQLTAEDIGKIKEARSKSLYGLSDEALHEYFALTKIIMTVKAKSK